MMMSLQGLNDVESFIITQPSHVEKLHDSITGSSVLDSISS